MLGLPKTTPTAAIMFTTGSLYASIRAQIKQLIYLQKILKKQDHHWTKVSLLALKQHGTGWARQIEDNLNEWALETDWNVIRMKSVIEWKRQVHQAAEKKNKEKILGECFKTTRGATEEKTKTKTLIPILEHNEYKRQPHPFITKNNKTKARAFIMGRYGMLQCAANFANGHGGKDCRNCGVIDNEHHRINDCPVWKDINLLNNTECLDFNLIHSDTEVEVLKVVETIITLWDLGNNRNCMRNEK